MKKYLFSFIVFGFTKMKTKINIIRKDRFSKTFLHPRSLRSLALIFLLCSALSSFSQNEKNQSIDEIINMSNSIYGADDRIEFGKVFKPTNDDKIGHPFFLHNNMSKGTIFLNGQKFKNVNLMYNIVLDEIFYRGANPTVVILTKSYVDSLIIDDRMIVNSNKLSIANRMGFLELLYNGHHTTFLKHKIGITHESTSNSISTKYLTPKLSLFIKHDDRLINLNTKKRLLSYFESNKRDISRFMKRNKIKFKKATQPQLLSLLKYCDGFPTN